MPPILTYLSLDANHHGTFDVANVQNSLQDVVQLSGITVCLFGQSMTDLCQFMKKIYDRPLSIHGENLLPNDL